VVSIFFAIIFLLHFSYPLPSSVIEMISKSFIVIQAFIAFIIIASSLTYSVNAAAIAPARQFLFLGLVDREDLC
jgi:hypothetical protein